MPIGGYASELRKPWSTWIERLVLAQGGLVYVRRFVC